jgi:acetyltransferase
MDTNYLDISINSTVVPFQDGRAGYPAHLTDSLPLLYGFDLTVRAIHPEDAMLTGEFLRGLSSESGYQRFLGPPPKPTPEILHRFTHIDYRQEMALVAVVFVGGVETEIGVVRYVVHENGLACELAIVVADAWQRRGIGRMLLQRLIEHAAAAGLQHVDGYVLATNQAMLNLARSLGFRVEPVPGDATVRHIIRCCCEEPPCSPNT